MSSYRREDKNMGWAMGYDSDWERDIGYGVPSTCDLPGCGARIDRGLAYVCGNEPRGGEDGCGLFFCEGHLAYGDGEQPVCPRCLVDEAPYEPTPDTADWLRWKLTDPSWGRWREENPDKVEAARLALAV